MTKATRWWCVSVAVVGTMLALMAGSNRAQDKKEPAKHDAKMLNDSLKDVINVGRKIYNEQGDHAGCYRLFQGSLLAVKPFVSPKLQTRIVEGMANAERMDTYADRAFELRRVIDEIRAAAKTGDKKDDGKDKKEEKKNDPDSKTEQVSGTVAYEGKPLPGGYSVTFTSKKKEKTTSPIQKDGTFKFAMPVAVGEYRVTIEPIAGEKSKVAVPPRYASAETSGIVINVTAGKNRVDLNLVK